MDTWVIIFAVSQVMVSITFLVCMIIVIRKIIKETEKMENPSNKATNGK